MNTLTGFLDRFLVPVANKMANNKYLSSVSTGFAYALPVIMVGALFTLASSLNLGFYPLLLVPELNQLFHLLLR